MTASRVENLSCLVLFYLISLISPKKLCFIRRCHGEKGNVIYEMAKDKNLLSSNVPTYRTYNFVRSNGDVIPPKTCERLTKLAMGILDREDHKAEKRAYHGSLGNYFAQKLVSFLAKSISISIVSSAK